MGSTSACVVNAMTILSSSEVRSSDPWPRCVLSVFQGPDNNAAIKRRQCVQLHLFHGSDQQAAFMQGRGRASPGKYVILNPRLCELPHTARGPLQDGRGRQRSFASPVRRVSALTGHTRGVTALVAPDGSWPASADYGGEVRGGE
jgi:hypothetical protein